MSVNIINKTTGALQKVAGKIENGGYTRLTSSDNIDDLVTPGNYGGYNGDNIGGTFPYTGNGQFAITIIKAREYPYQICHMGYGLWQRYADVSGTTVKWSDWKRFATDTDISDLQDDKQDKTLETPLTIDGTSRTTVEGALGGLQEEVDYAIMEAKTARGEIGDITSLETTDQTDLVSAINELVPSDASASNKLMTRKCIRYNNASDLENAIVNLPDHSQLDFAAMSAITIGGVTLPQYTAWHIYRDSNGLACIGGVGYSYVDGSCYKIQGSINSPKVAGLSLTMQKLVTDSDLTSSITSGSNAPITSGGVYDALNNKTSVTATPAGSDVSIAGYTIYYYPQTKRMLFNKCHIVYTQGPTMPAERPLCTITIPDGITIPENIIIIPAILSVPATGEKIPSAVMLYPDGTIMTTNSEKNYQCISISGANVFFE